MSESTPRKRPAAGLLLLRPAARSYRDILRQTEGLVETLKAVHGQANSDMIAAASQGPFSHSVLYRGERIIDAVSHRDDGRPLIAVGSLPAVVRRQRSMSFYAHHDDGAIDAAFTAGERYVEATTPPGDVELLADLPLDEEPNRFSVDGVVQMGIILVASQRTGLRWLARLITRFHRDPKGMFCSELVTKAILAGGHTFEVLVDESRIPPRSSTAMRELAELLAVRAAYWNRLSAEQGIDTDASAPVDPDVIVQRLGDLREDLATPAVAGAAITTRPVGWRDGEFPPPLVGPNDLARSPSFGWVENENPSSGSEPELDVPASLPKVLLLGATVFVLRKVLRKLTEPAAWPPPNPTTDS